MIQTMISNNHHNIYNVGIYCRLSKDDNTGNESNSIISQKEILSDFVNKQGWKISNVYIDDGFSGTNFNRPGFKSLINDIENKLINCVVVKDLSRLGRNYLDSGYYIEKYFPENNVRFIALNDNMDTIKEEENEFAPFKNIINEWYAKDISKKIKFSLNNKAQQGNLIQGHAPYGYILKDNNFIIDEEASKVVKYIFEATASKIPCKDIISKLKKDKVLVPGYYQYLKNGYAKDKYSNITEEEKYDWTFWKLTTIIRNEAYTGTLVNYKKRKVSFRSKRLILNDPSKVLKTLDRFPAIISKEIYDEANKIRKEKYRAPKSKQDNPFLHILFCEDCGKYLKLRKNSHKIEKYNFYYYRCESKTGGCGGHNIRVDKLKELVLEDFKNLQEILNNIPKEEIKNILIKENDKLNSKHITKSTLELESINKRINELDNVINKLIDSYSKKIIPELTYQKLMIKYKSEYEELLTKERKYKTINNNQRVTNLTLDEQLDFILSIDNDNFYEDNLVSKIVKNIYIKEETINNKKEQTITIEYFNLGALTKYYE